MKDYSVQLVVVSKVLYQLTIPLLLEKKDRNILKEMLDDVLKLHQSITESNIVFPVL